MLDLRWLSTWQPYTEMLGDRLGWDDSVVSSVFWHDPNTHEGRVMQKLDLIMNEIIKQRERVERGYDAHAIIWVDDGAINNRTITALIHTQLASPLLLISPDARIGISRRQLELIYTFVNRPPSTPCVIYSCPWDEKGHVIGTVKTIPMMRWNDVMTRRVRYRGRMHRRFRGSLPRVLFPATYAG